MTNLIYLGSVTSVNCTQKLMAKLYKYQFIDLTSLIT
jgi:hypothetical protein